MLAPLTSIRGYLSALVAYLLTDHTKLSWWSYLHRLSFLLLLLGYYL